LIGCSIPSDFLPLSKFSLLSDFTRLKLVKAKKEIEQKREAKQKEDEIAAGTRSAGGKENDADITAAFDAGDDADVVF
jgi:hypothetical protein